MSILHLIWYIFHIHPLNLLLHMQNLYLFLAQPNCLVHLDLSGTDCTVDSVCIRSLFIHPSLSDLIFRAGYRHKELKSMAL